MKKLLIGLAFLVPLLAYASTTTPNLGLVIPANGDQNWDVQLRNDFNTIDSNVSVLTLANYFTAQQRMASLRLDGALSLYSGASGSGLVTFQNSSVLNKNRLILSASDGMFINGAEFPGGASVSAGDLVLYPGTGHTYGTFAVIGSSADGTTAYSGFSATAPITTSTIWTLPKADGTANQPLVTDGSGHLSFSSESGTFIQNTNTLQTGTTFYVSSGTVRNSLTVGSTVTASAFNFGTSQLRDGNDNILLGETVPTPSGSNNVCIGPSSPCSTFMTGGSVAIGFAALSSTGTGVNNVAIGPGAMQIATADGGENVAIGDSALSHLSHPPIGLNVAVGASASQNLSTGYESTAVGYEALWHQTTPNENTAVGISAAADLTTGFSNTAIGSWALQHALGTGNVALGHSAGGGGDNSVANSFVNGSLNVFIGYEASAISSTTQVDSSIVIGRAATVGTSAYPAASNVSNAVAIGWGASAPNSNTMVLGGEGLQALEVFASTFTAKGYIGLASKTSATLNGLVPRFAGEEYYCSDCVTVPVCVSTGTAAGAFSLITSRTAACK